MQGYNTKDFSPFSDNDLAEPLASRFVRATTTCIDTPKKLSAIPPTIWEEYNQ